MLDYFLHSLHSSLFYPRQYKNMVSVQPVSTETVRKGPPSSLTMEEINRHASGSSVITVSQSFCFIRSYSGSFFNLPSRTIRLSILPSFLRYRSQFVLNNLFLYFKLFLYLEALINYSIYHLVPLYKYIYYTKRS